MDAQRYLSERVDDQIKWYGNKSSRNKRAHHLLRIVEIVAAALIPSLTGYVDEKTGGVKLAVGLLGVIVAVAAGLLALYKLQENWLQYRATYEALKHEKFCGLRADHPACRYRGRAAAAAC